MAGGELRAAAAVDGEHTGRRAVSSPVFVPREEGPAVSWLLTEAALATSEA
jgi:hypothetical protein